MPIRIKLLILFLAISIIPLTFLGFINFSNFKETLKNSHLSKLEIIAELKSKGIENFFDNIKKEILFFSNNTTTSNSILDIYNNSNYIKTHKNIIDNQFKELIQETNDIVSLNIINLNNQIIYSANSLNNIVYKRHPLTDIEINMLKKKKPEFYISNIININNKKIMFIDLPHRDNYNNLLYIISFGIDMKNIFNFIKDTTGLGNTGETLIGKTINNELFFLNTVRYQNELTMKRTIKIGSNDAIPLQNAALGKNGSGISIDYRGKEIIAAWRHIPLLDWGLVSKIDTSEAFQDIIKMQYLSILVGIIILIVIIITSLITSTSITNPILKLTKYSDEISNGNLNIHIDIDSGDEIEFLANRFNKMTTDLKQYRDNLIESNEYTDSIISSMIDSLIVIDTNGTIKRVNNALTNLLGYSSNELINQSASLIFDEKENNEENTFSHKFKNSIFKDLIKDGLTINREINLINRTGEKIAVNFSGSVLRNRLSETIGIVGIAHDIREFKILQHQLSQSEKLSSIGQLTAGIAHELNSPLAGLLSFIRTYKKNSKPDSLEFKDFSLMLSASEHMAKIIEDLTSFARKSTDEFMELNLNDLIETTLGFSQRQLTIKNIKIIKDYAPDLLKILGNKNKLQQVILNIITNARDAMPHGGNFVIKTTNLNNDKISMEFLDTGVGIDKNTLDKILEPFFTTKDIGKGVGLGLSVSHGIIKSHNGEIEIESEPNVGTKIKITFPKSIKQ